MEYGVLLSLNPYSEKWQSEPIFCFTAPLKKRPSKTTPKDKYSKVYVAFDEYSSRITT
jgi:hypothetical protein